MGAQNSTLEKANRRIDRSQKKLKELGDYFEKDRIKRESELSSPPTRPAPTPTPRRQAPQPPPTRPAPEPPQRQRRKRKPYVIGQNDERETGEDYQEQGQRTHQQPRAAPTQVLYDNEGYTIQSAGDYNPSDYGYGSNNNNGGYSNNNGGYSNDYGYNNNNGGYSNGGYSNDYGYNNNNGGYSNGGYSNDYGYNNNNGGYSNDVYSSNNNGYQQANNGNNPEGCSIM